MFVCMHAAYHVTGHLWNAAKRRDRHAAIRQFLRVAWRAVPEARGGLLLPG
jgi:hypothetical protein